MIYWLFTLVPLYFAGGGYMYRYVHTHPRHDERKCNDGRNMPCFLWAGVGWPVTIMFLLLIAFWKLGERLEDQRPVHRKERREIERKKDLRAIHDR